MAELNKRTLFTSRERSEDGEVAQRLRRLRRNSAVRWAIVSVMVFVAALMLPHTTLVDFHNELGSIWTGDTLRAPFVFPLYKEESQLKGEMDAAADSVLPVFVPTGTTPATVNDTLASLARMVTDGTRTPRFLSESSWAYLGSLPPDTRALRLLAITQALANVLATPYRAGIINQSKRSVRSDQITVRRADVYEDVLPITAVYDSLSTLQTVEAGVSPRLNNAVEAAVAMEFYYRVYRPTLAFSASLTQEAIDNARESVPRSLGIVAEGEVIVGKGERITELVKLKLNSYKKSRALREVETKPYWQMLGNLLHVSILVGLVMIYLWNFRPRIFHDNLQIIILSALILLTALFAWLSRVLGSDLPLEYLIPVPLITMLLVILFDSRTAFYLTATACFVIAAVRGADYSSGLVALSAGALVIYAVRDIRSRTQLFRAIAYSLAGYAVAIVALSLGRGDSMGDVGLRFAFAGINATFSPVLTFAMVLLLENIFGIATDLKLVEFDNLDHPLLRALADKAPGTYQHTLTISRLAESAATAVNANALLAKVGTLFHDIGKIPRAEYFVENQMGIGNKHDRMKPEKSARIIRDHVVEGIELAREYGLPQRIIDFIPMHHGTTSIQYFLDKAREGGAEVDDAQFRYPGPLPQSRETGIAMLADAVEATIRSMQAQTPKAIEETVDKVIKRRFSEGQLDECELTLADLTKIKKAFVKNLIGMSHPRIKYKEQPGEGEETRDLERPEGPKDESTSPYINDAFNVDAEYTYAKDKKRKDD